MLESSLNGKVNHEAAVRTDPNKLLIFTLYAFLVGLLATLTPDAVRNLLGLGESGASWHPGWWWVATAAILGVLYFVYDPSVQKWFQARTAPTGLILS